MIKALLSFVLIYSTTVSAQTPIPRKGDSCPTGWYKSDGYCTKYNK
jgi:hypothetical protein